MKFDGKYMLLVALCLIVLLLLTVIGKGNIKHKEAMATIASLQAKIGEMQNSTPRDDWGTSGTQSTDRKPTQVWGTATVCYKNGQTFLWVDMCQGGDEAGAKAWMENRCKAAAPDGTGWMTVACGYQVP
jgi:hypothetical protein